MQAAITTIAGMASGDKLSALSAPQLMVEHACDPSLQQPNLALNLEICDLINEKAKSTPREAAFACSAMINNRQPQSGVLACALLDTCTKNCGYPFHLIVSTKEFLNDLVKRFPDRPVNVGPVQYHILDLIGSWNATLCTTSRHKDDFKHINDMYRLLQYKGYRFPETSRYDAIAAIPDDTLRTEDELEQEDKIVQGAKLQELLRKGTPAALEEANELMQVMAGYDQEKIPDYKKIVDEELEKIQNKCLILSGILDGKTNRFEPDPTLEELQAHVRSAQHRIQKILGEEENQDRMDQLLTINDLINGVLHNYDVFKNGSGEKREIVLGAAPGPSSSESTGAICLIDLDYDPPADPSTGGSSSLTPSSNSKPAQQQQPVADLLGDLASLDFSSSGSSSAPKPAASSGLSDIDQLFKGPLSGANSASTQDAKEAVLLNKNGLQIKMQYSSDASGRLTGLVTVINTTPVAFKDLELSFAVPKIEPLSSLTVAPLNTAPVTQKLTVDTNTPNGTGFKMRFKTAYTVNGAKVEETGEV